MMCQVLFLVRVVWNHNVKMFNKFDKLQRI